MSLTDWSSKWSIYQPESIAFQEWETKHSITFKALHDQACRICHAFEQRFDLKQGDRIALLAENNLDYLVLFAAAQKAGWILVPLNYRLAGPEIAFLIGDAMPSLIIQEMQFQQKLIEASAKHSDIPVLNWQALSTIGSDPGYLDQYPALTYELNTPIFILYTSGTTGYPKGALYTHKMLFWNSINTSMSLIVNTESKTVNCMPPFHTGGWNVLTTPFFHHGGQSWLMRNFDPAGVLELIEQEKLTIFMAVPTMLKMISELPEFESADLSALLYLIVGGEPMPMPLIEKWESKGVAVRQGFGMTEAGPNLTSLHQRDAIRKKGSIGRPNFYVQTRIVNESFKDCQAGEAGELWLKGPMVTPSYWKNPTASKEAFHEGWFRTGDRVLEDEEGFLYVVDRIKNMFISGGENVYPAEVERVLQSHPKVIDVIVIGVPDQTWGECGKALIVCESSLDSEELISHCQLRLAKFKVPKYFVQLSALPKNDTGKIDRKALIAAYR